MKKIITTLLSVCLLGLFNLNAQVSSYSFTQTIGTYVTITGGTVIAHGTADDSVYTGLPVGFTFNYNGVNYTTFGLNINGWITLGSSTPVNSYTPLSDGMNNNVICALGKNLQFGFVSNGTYTSGSNTITNVGSTAGYAVGDELVTHAGFAAGTTITAIGSNTLTVSSTAFASGVSTYAVKGTFRYGILGTAPNRICVLQWTKARRFGTTISEGRYDLFNFQIRLHETTNEVQFCYNNFQTNTTSSAYQVGITGSSNSDFSNRTTTSNWSSTTAGTVNTAICSLSTTVKPASGLIYTWTPTNNNCTLCYCTPPASDCSWDDLINSVDFVTISNFSGCGSASGYNSYSTPVPNLYRGQTYPITVSVGTEAAIDQVTLWIDYNQNGVFEASEFSILGTGNDNIIANVTIPLNAVLGNTGMRIRARSVDAFIDPNNIPLTGNDACTGVSTGETEDYVVNIMDNSVGLQENGMVSDFSVYPNPATGRLYIAAQDNYQEFSIAIFDVQGKQCYYSVEKNTVSGSVKAINVEEFAKGMYILKIQAPNALKTQRVVIE